MELTQIFTIAAKEFRDRMRNRWVLAVALVFTVFSLVIAYFGGAQQGAVGFRSIEFTIASLVSLVIYLIPLIALLLGFDAIVGERERGSLDLLLSLPITRLELLLGKYLGLAAALALSTLAGFGMVAVLLSRQMSWASMYHYFGFMLSSVLLGLAFLSLAVLLSVLARDRTRASGLAIATWFFFVLVFDLLLLGVLVGSGGRFGGESFALLLLLNPADVFRILNVFSLEDVRTLYGLATVVPPAMGSPLKMAAPCWSGLQCHWLWRIGGSSHDIPLFLPPPPAGLGGHFRCICHRPAGLVVRLQRAGRAAALAGAGRNRPLHQLRTRRHAAGRLPRPQGADPLRGPGQALLLLRHGGAVQHPARRRAGAPHTRRLCAGHGPGPMGRA